MLCETVSQCRSSCISSDRQSYCASFASAKLGVCDGTDSQPVGQANKQVLSMHTRRVLKMLSKSLARRCVWSWCFVMIKSSTTSSGRGRRLAHCWLWTVLESQVSTAPQQVCWTFWDVNNQFLLFWQSWLARITGCLRRTRLIGVALRPPCLLTTSPWFRV